MTIKGPGPVPKDALDYFNAKVHLPGFDYRDVWREEHAHAFTVAKATQMDVLTDIRGALKDALADGKTLRQFEKELTPTLQAKGWWGKKDMVDPETGDTVTAQLGSPRRLKTIYRANMRTARAAGQWQRAERTKKALPYMLYELGPSREHREEHVAWHGTLLPIDDPWWESHMPPNGWGCKCRVRQVSRIEAERLKTKGVPAADRAQEIDPETGLPTGRRVKRTAPVKTTAPKTEYVDWKNKRTGQVEQVPAGIDPGWDTNPGKVRQQNLENVLAGKIDGMPEPARDVAVKDLASSGRFGRWVDTVLERKQARGETQIIGAVKGHVRSFVAKQGVTMETNVIMIDDKGLMHSAGDKKNSRGAAIGRDDLRHLPARLLDADCYWDAKDPALVYAFQAAGREGKMATAVVRVNFIRKKTITNRVVTTGIVQPENLGDPRYTLIMK